MSNTSTGREIDEFTKWCTKWAVGLEEIFYNQAYNELGDKITFDDLTDKYSKDYVLRAYKGLEALITSHTNAARIEMLDRIEESVKQHTVPEGKHLVTRSYVLNTLEFERNRTQKESAEKTLI